MIPMPMPVLNPNLTALKSMLVKTHRLSVSGGVWYVDDKMAIWPERGRYKFSNSKGGGSGTLRGSAESMFEQIEKLLSAV